MSQNSGIEGPEELEMKLCWYDNNKNQQLYFYFICFVMLLLAGIWIYRKINVQIFCLLLIFKQLFDCLCQDETLSHDECHFPAVAQSILPFTFGCWYAAMPANQRAAACMWRRRQAGSSRGFVENTNPLSGMASTAEHAHSAGLTQHLWISFLFKNKESAQRFLIQAVHQV